MSEEIFETAQPTESTPLDWPKIILVAVLGFGLLAGAAYAGCWYGTQKLKDDTAKQETSTPESEEQKESQTIDVEGRIAFVRDQKIWIINANCSEEKELVSVGKVENLLWSPDGESIAFKMVVGENQDKIGTVNIESRQITYVAEGSFRWPYAASHGTFYQWSSDGKRIYFIDGNKGLMVVNVETRDSGVLVEGARGPIWVGSRKVYFYVPEPPPSSSKEMFSSIYSVDTTSGERSLTLGLKTLVIPDNFNFDISLDKSKIAYAASRGKSITISDLNGENEIQLPRPEGGSLDYLLWAPSGRQLLASFFVKDNTDFRYIGNLWLMGLDGWNTLVCEECGKPSFSPDGRYFAHTYVYYCGFYGHRCEGYLNPGSGCVVDFTGVTVYDATRGVDIQITGLEVESKIRGTAKSRAVESSPVWSPK